MKKNCDFISVFNLVRQTADDLALAEEKLLAAEVEPQVIRSGETLNCVKWFVVKSGEMKYLAARFYEFYFCECPDFKYSQGKACKHLALLNEPVCKNCRRRTPQRRGALCGVCEVTQSPYLKPSTNQKPMMVGNIRI